MGGELPARASGGGDKEGKGEKFQEEDERELKLVDLRAAFRERTANCQSMRLETSRRR